MIKFFCDVCGTQPVDIEPIERDELNNTPHGDIICKKCRLVIATVSADREGELRFVKSEFETLLDVAEQALSGIDFEAREVLGFAPLDVLRAAVGKYRV